MRQLLKTRYTPGCGRFMKTWPVKLPDRLSAELKVWNGPEPGVSEAPLLVKVIVVALENDRLRTPPNIPSMTWKFGFNAAVPQAPARSPVLGTVSPIFEVV